VCRYIDYRAIIAHRHNDNEISEAEYFSTPQRAIEPRVRLKFFVHLYEVLLVVFEFEKEMCRVRLRDLEKIVRLYVVRNVSLFPSNLKVVRSTEIIDSDPGIATLEVVDDVVIGSIFEVVFRVERG
jgi:hypothetical protein